MADDRWEHQSWHSSAWARGEKHTECKLLTGHNFPPYPKPKVPKSIRATPQVICSACERTPVMPELKALTKGRCWACHLKG